MRAHGTHHKAEAEFCQHELPVRSFIPRVPEVYGRKLMSAGSEQAAEDSCRGEDRVKEGQGPASILQRPRPHPGATRRTGVPPQARPGGRTGVHIRTYVIQQPAAYAQAPWNTSCIKPCTSDVWPLINSLRWPGWYMTHGCRERVSGNARTRVQDGAMFTVV